MELSKDEIDKIFNNKELIDFITSPEPSLSNNTTKIDNLEKMAEAIQAVSELPLDFWRENEQDKS